MVSMLYGSVLKAVFGKAFAVFFNITMGFLGVVVDADGIHIINYR